MLSTEPGRRVPTRPGPGAPWATQSPRTRDSPWKGHPQAPAAAAFPRVCFQGQEWGKVDIFARMVRCPPLPPRVPVASGRAAGVSRLPRQRLAHTVSPLPAQPWSPRAARR